MKFDPLAFQNIFETFSNKSPDHVTIKSEPRIKKNEDKQLETKIYWICGFCLSRCCSASLLLKKCNRIRILFLSRSPFSLMTGKRSPLNWPTSDLFPLASSFPGNLTVTTSSLTVQSLHWPSPSMGHVDNVA